MVSDEMGPMPAVRGESKEREKLVPDMTSSVG